MILGCLGNLGEQRSWFALDWSKEIHGNELGQQLGLTEPDVSHVGWLCSHVMISNDIIPAY